MCCQEASISSEDLPVPFPQLIGSAGGSPLATSAGSHAGTLDPSDPGSHIQAWIHIPVVGGEDDTPAAGMAFGFGLCGSSSADIMPFPFAGVAPLLLGGGLCLELPFPFRLLCLCPKGKFPWAQPAPFGSPPAQEPESLCLHPLVRGLGGVWGYPLGAFRPPYACHVKQGSVTFETSKSNHFWSNPHRHGHRALMRMVADGCGRLRTVAQRLANTASTPNPQSETGTLATQSGKGANGQRKSPEWVEIKKQSHCWTPAVNAFSESWWHVQALLRVILALKFAAGSSIQSTLAVQVFVIQSGADCF